MKLKKDFHPRLFGFAGFSGAGKTTLIEKLIAAMKDFRIGYIKHDAHRFEMDLAGKDTYRQYQAGAEIVFINDPEHFCLQAKGESFTLEKEYFKDCDLVIAEGHKYSDHAKFLFLDEAGQAFEEFNSGKIKNVMAVIYLQEGQARPSGIPAFHRDDLASIIAFMRKRILCSIESVELCGLILAGGHSSRMGQDKSLLQYHDRPQAQYLFDLLTAVKVKPFLSCREEQREHKELNQLRAIPDRFINFGPLGGILSAMVSQPDKAWLVIACDLPLVTEEKVLELISARDPLKQATACFNHERKQYEPLFAIYEPGIFSRMLHFLGEGMSCPQKVLFNSSVKTLPLETQAHLENANTPEDYARLMKVLQVKSQREF